MIMKRGDASIVATVLLIVSAIAIALMVTTFSKQTGEQVSEKIITMGSSVECADVRISVTDFDGDRTVTLRNRGTLGIEKAVARIYSDKIATENLVFGAVGEGTKCSGSGIVNNKLMPNGQDSICRFGSGEISGDIYKIEIIPIIETEDGELGCEDRITTWTN